MLKATPKQAESVVVPLNDASALFAALAEGIRGTAIGWSPDALQRLEDGLEDRYGLLLGDSDAIKRLLVLATGPIAA